MSERTLESDGHSDFPRNSEKSHANRLRSSQTNDTRNGGTIISTEGQNSIVKEKLPEVQEEPKHVYLNLLEMVKLQIESPNKAIKSDTPNKAMPCDKTSPKLQTTYAKIIIERKSMNRFSQTPERNTAPNNQQNSPAKTRVQTEMPPEKKKWNSKSPTPSERAKNSLQSSKSVPKHRKSQTVTNGILNTHGDTPKYYRAAKKNVHTPERPLSTREKTLSSERKIETVPAELPSANEEIKPLVRNSTPVSSSSLYGNRNSERISQGNKPANFQLQAKPAQKSQPNPSLRKAQTPTSSFSQLSQGKTSCTSHKETITSPIAGSIDPRTRNLFARSKYNPNLSKNRLTELNQKPRENQLIAAQNEYKASGESSPTTQTPGGQMELISPKISAVKDELIKPTIKNEPVIDSTPKFSQSQGDPEKLFSQITQPQQSKQSYNLQSFLNSVRLREDKVFATRNHQDCLIMSKEELLKNPTVHVLNMDHWEKVIEKAKADLHDEVTSGQQSPGKDGLYKKGISWINEKNLKIEKKREEVAQSEMNRCTFRPFLTHKDLFSKASKRDSTTTPSSRSTVVGTSPSHQRGRLSQNSSYSKLHENKTRSSSRESVEAVRNLTRASSSKSMSMNNKSATNIQSPKIIVNNEGIRNTLRISDFLRNAKQRDEISS